METHPGQGVMKEEKETVGNPLTGGSVGSFGISEGTTTGRGKKQNPQNRCLTATASGEVAQTLTSTTSERGLDREVWAASTVLRVRTGPECPEDNLRELTQSEIAPQTVGSAERKKMRTFLRKALTHSLATHRTKD